MPIATIGNGFELVRYSRIPNTTGGYVANRRFAKAFIAHRGIRHIMVDEEMRRPWKRGFVTYGIVPPPVTGNVLDQSSIDMQGDRRYRTGLRLSANTTLDRRMDPPHPVQPQFLDAAIMVAVPGTQHFRASESTNDR